MTLDAIILGLVNGLSYAILGVGLVLIYKSGRFINFAHGNLGALAAVLFGTLVIDVGMPFWVALPLVLLGAGAVGALIELTVIRRLFESPRLVLVVATIALSQLLLFLTIQPWAQADQQELVLSGYPTAFEAQVTVGNVVLSAADLSVLAVVPLLALALAAFFRWSPYGQAIRAAAENPDAARLAGISVARMSTIVWVLAAVLAAVTAILLAPNRPVFQVGALGPSILVRALGAGLVGRMTNLPITFAAGIGLGVVEAVAFAESNAGGITDLVVFIVVMAALAFRARELSQTARSADAGISFGAETRELPADVAAIPGVRRLRTGSILGCALLAAALPLLPVLGLNTSAKTFLLTLVCGYAIVGLSLTVLTGWAGQVSLGQFALVGVGAFAAARLGDTVPLPVMLVSAGLVGVVVAIIVGLPAVRIQGLFLAVSTLAFAVVAEGWAFQQEVFVVEPAGVFLPRPGLFRSERAVYWLALSLVIAFAWLAGNLRRTGPGRLLIAVRDNDRAAGSEGVSTTGTRLLGFAISGFMAACAGVIFAFARQNFTATDFDPTTSLTVLLMVIVGGLGSIGGALLGAVFLFGIPVIFDSSDVVQLLTSAVGVLVVLLFLPGGLISLVHQARDAIIARSVRSARGEPAPQRIVPPLGTLWRVAIGRE